MSAKLVLVVVVGLIAAFGAASGEIKIDESDDILKYVKIEKEFSDDVREALLALEIPAGKEITKDVLEKAFKKSGKLIYVKHNLLMVESYCSDDLIKSLIVVFKEEELQRFSSFFESYWNGKFQECANIERDQLIKDCEKLNSFKSLKGYFEDAVPTKEKLPAGNDARFLLSQCHSTFYPRRRSFAIVNLAQRFEGAKGAANEADQLKFDICNEWNNICWSWLNDEGSDDGE